MARPRSSIATLQRMIRLAEPGGNNLGRYLAEHREELAQRLGVDSEKLAALVALPDEQVARLLEQLFDRRAAERAAAYQAEVRDVALAAAQRLGAEAMWFNGSAGLDVQLLIGELLTDTSCSYITFEAVGLRGGFKVSLPRSLLLNVAKELRQRPDFLAWVHEAGLHFRWNRGRGGLNFFSQCVPASEAAHVLTVNISPPIIKPPSAPEARGRWFSDLLSEVALA